MADTTTTVGAAAAAGALVVSAFTGATLFQSALPAVDGQCHITTTISAETTCDNVDPYFGYCFYPRYPGKCPT